MKKIRLDKYLADMGVDSRTGIRQRIRQGQAAVNGETVYKADFRVDVERDSVSLQGVPVPYEEFQYFMLNKPQGGGDGYPGQEGKDRAGTASRPAAQGSIPGGPPG